MKKKILLSTILLTLFFAMQSMAQQQIIKGKITDLSNETIVGVNIVIKGTTNGTISDIDGAYSVSASANDVLVFTFIGYQSQSVLVGTQSTINVQLEEDLLQLGEIIVSALGFEQNKDEMGSTAAVVSSEDMNRSGESTLLNSLGGKASNVQVQRSNGDPGAGSTIRIRGASTISGSSNPLIIVDGIPINNSTYYGSGNGGRDAGTSQQSRLNDLNPSDIESMQILKGASAAALWGSRAANGVIVITTKNGAAGRINIAYKGTYSIDQVNSRIPMQTTFGQGKEGKYEEKNGESWGDYIPDRLGGSDEVDKSGKYFLADGGRKYYPITTKKSKETFTDSNWDGAIQEGHFFQHDISVSGGDEKATYFFSLGKLDQEGIIIGSTYDRTNLRLNNTVELNDWLKVSNKASYTNSFSNRIQQSSNTAGLMLGLLRASPDFDNTDYIGTYYAGILGDSAHKRQRAYRRPLGSSSSPIYNNPMWTTREQESSTRVSRFMITPEFSIMPTDWLSVILRGGIDVYNDARVYFFPINSASNTSGTFTEEGINAQEINFDAITKANFNLTSDISLQATAGWNINDKKRKVNYASLQGFKVNIKKQTSNLNTSANASQIESNKRFIRSNRGYGILAFDMYGQLNVNLSGAVEAASSVKGSFFYPAAEVAWQLGEAIDLSATPISFAKLRATWGKVGVQPEAHKFQNLTEGDFSYSTYSDPLDAALFGGGYRLDDDLGNPDLMPEMKTEWEVGADVRLFEEKLSLGLTYYQNKITGILIDLPLSPSFGYNNRYANAASMENKGFELDLDYTLFSTNDWNVGVFGNFSDNNNKVTDLNGSKSIDLTLGASISSRAVEGYPLGVLYGTGSQINENDGSFILDNNGFPQITKSPVVLGDPNPDWKSGFGIRANWKSLSINILLAHLNGGEFSPRTLWVLNSFGTTKETDNYFKTSTDLVNYAGNTIPAGTQVRGNTKNFGGGDVLLDESWYKGAIGGGFGDAQAYNFSIKDATLTRLKEISISYAINSSSFREATKLSSIVFTATGRNLFLWTEIEGIDPEINQYGVSSGFGVDYFTNPSTRSLLFSIAINF